MSALAPVPVDAAGEIETELLGCASCGLVSRNALSSSDVADGLAQRCPRCGHAVHRRKPQSLQRTWACVLAAAVCYIPANTLPIMSTTSGFVEDEHTLLGGIHELWIDGSWLLAIIVFVASIAVPVLKIGVLALLAASVRMAPDWRRLERARLYRLIDAVGHWSMLDVYVVVLLSATVRFGGLATAHAEPGLLAFAAVVVLTIIATFSFDPKMIWQGESRLVYRMPVEKRHQVEAIAAPAEFPTDPRADAPPFAHDTTAGR